MNFIEQISNYILGNVSISQLPQIGQVGLDENLDSESLVILAGMSENDNSFEIEEYYKKTLVELNKKEPNKLEAAKNLLNYYLKKLVSSPDDAFFYMVKIDNEIYKKADWKLIAKKNPKYIGEELGIERLFTWYRELQDWKDKSKLLYYTELPREVQKKKFEEHLVNESNNLLQMFKDEENTAHNKV